MVKTSATGANDFDTDILAVGAAGVGWPVEDCALVALTDVGLTVAQIAKYFSVTTTDVQVLMDRLDRVEQEILGLSRT